MASYEITKSELTLEQKQVIKMFETYYGREVKHIEFTMCSFRFDQDNRRAFVDTPDNVFYFGFIISLNHFYLRFNHQNTMLDYEGLSLYNSLFGKFIHGASQTNPLIFQSIEMTSGTQSWGCNFRGLRITM